MSKRFPFGSIQVKQSKEDLRNSILKLEEEMFKKNQVEIPTKHHFAKGLYAREIFIPKDTLLTGKIHKTEHLNIISKGKIIVYTDEGMKEISAPTTLISSPGTKRVGYALEDTIWTTIHATNETDLEKIEDELIAKSFDDPDLIELCNTEKIKGDVCHM